MRMDGICLYGNMGSCRFLCTRPHKGKYILIIEMRSFGTRFCTVLHYLHEVNALHKVLEKNLDSVYTREGKDLLEGQPRWYETAQVILAGGFK